jgi:dihydrofolate reductase
MIVAVDTAGAIGYKNELLFHSKEDMQHFKRTTLNRTVVMGVNTAKSLPKFPLPKRKNIVYGRKPVEGAYAEYAMYKEDIIKLAKKEEVYIIGGGQTYRAFMKYADGLIVTIFKDKAEQADTYFPEIDHSLFKWIDTLPLKDNKGEIHTFIRR